MKMEQTKCSETLAYKIQTPGNYPEENIQLKEPCLVNPGKMFVPPLHIKMGLLKRFMKVNKKWRSFPLLAQ